MFKILQLSFKQIIAFQEKHTSALQESRSTWRLEFNKASTNHWSHSYTLQHNQFTHKNVYWELVKKYRVGQIVKDIVFNVRSLLCIYYMFACVTWYWLTGTNRKFSFPLLKVDARFNSRNNTEFLCIPSPTIILVYTIRSTIIDHQIWKKLN